MGRFECRLKCPVEVWSLCCLSPVKMVCLCINAQFLVVCLWLHCRLLGLLLTFEHLRCWREGLYVRPVGYALRVVSLKLRRFSRGSGQPRTKAWLWILAEVSLSGPNSVNAFVVRCYGFGRIMSTNTETSSILKKSSSIFCVSACNKYDNSKAFMSLLFPAVNSFALSE